jgi:hypothetical protein
MGSEKLWKDLENYQRITESTDKCLDLQTKYPSRDTVPLMAHGTTRLFSQLF